MPSLSRLRVVQRFTESRPAASHDPSTTTNGHDGGGPPGASRSRGLAHFLAARPSSRVVVAFLIVFVAASLISSRFPTSSNLLGILQAMTFEGLLAVGLGCGLVNGLVAELFQIPAVVVTLATLGVYAGLALVISGGSPVSSIGYHPGFFTGFGAGDVVGQLTWLSVIYVAVAVVAGLVLQGTTFGFRIFAVGSNPRAARLVGINVPLIRIGLLTISGLTAGAGAVLSLAYLQSASPISGTSYALDVLAAVIIGGVSLTGGRGTMLGVFLGLGVVQIISNMLTLTGVSPNWQSAVSGVVLVLAVGVQRLGVRRDARR